MFDSTLFLDKIKRKYNSDNFDYVTFSVNITSSATATVTKQVALNDDYAIRTNEEVPYDTRIQSNSELEIIDINSETEINLKFHTGIMNITLPIEATPTKYSLQFIRVIKTN